MKTTEQKNAKAVIAMQKRIDELEAEIKSWKYRHLGVSASVKANEKLINKLYARIDNYEKDYIYERLQNEQLQAENKKLIAGVDKINNEGVRLRRENKDLKKEGTNVMLALEDVVEHWDDNNWPEDTGWSKSDCNKLCNTWEQLL